MKESLFAEVRIRMLRLLEFLKVELSQQGKIIIFNKSKKCLGMVPVCNAPSYKKENKDKPGRYIHTTVRDLKNKCHICDEFGHKISCNRNGRETVHYFACKMFVEMSPD